MKNKLIMVSAVTSILVMACGSAPAERVATHSSPIALVRPTAVTIELPTTTAPPVEAPAPPAVVDAPAPVVASAATAEPAAAEPVIEAPPAEAPVAPAPDPVPAPAPEPGPCNPVKPGSLCPGSAPYTGPAVHTNYYNRDESGTYCPPDGYSWEYTIWTPLAPWADQWPIAGVDCDPSLPIVLVDQYGGP